MHTSPHPTTTLQPLSTAEAHAVIGGAPAPLRYPFDQIIVEPPYTPVIVTLSDPAPTAAAAS